MAKKVILGLSGGVDSSASAIRLKEEGYDVTGVFMRNWDSTLNNDRLGNPTVNDDVCPQEVDYQDAVDVANKIGIKMDRVDFIEEYWNYVFKYFLDEYQKGRTPNPDVMCNKEIKFKAFLNYAFSHDADYIAMGHYAQVKRDSDGTTHLMRAVDQNKDQTYFLCLLTQDQIKKALFPIGDMVKPDVRKLAAKYNLDTATKKDSTGICFIGERNFHKFLQNYLPAQPGNIETVDHTVLGRHDGLMYYTIGQRKGLNLGGMKGYKNEPWFVLGKNIKRNVLVVGQGEDNPLLKSNKLIASHINFIASTPTCDKTYQAKFRYREKDTDVCLKIVGDTLEVTYKEAFGVTPGQIVCLYDKDECIGGAIIEEVYYNDELRTVFED